jgi:hypothetical protein
VKILGVVLVGWCLVACGGGGGGSPYPSHLYDCQASGSVTAVLPGGTETATHDYCQLYLVESEHIAGVAMAASNFGGWQRGSEVFVALRYRDATYRDTTFEIVPFEGDGWRGPPGTASIEYVSNMSDTAGRRRFVAHGGGTLTLTAPLLVGGEGSASARIAMTDLALSEGATLTFDDQVSTSSVANMCRPWAESVIDKATELGCAGAGGDVDEFEEQCNIFIIQYVEVANCTGVYTSYVECGMQATMCDPCRAEYCDFNACMCETWSVESGACLAECF